ncbi:exodeoxyribonuclease III [Patescibacteria group bacterium]
MDKKTKKIISWNVNGLRAVYKRDSLAWFKEMDADIVCLQEIKADFDQLPQDLTSIPGYFVYTNSAQKKGYSGVLVYSRGKPKKITKVLGLPRFDQEGRLLELQFRDFTLFNLYIPHGGRQKENLEYKLVVYKKLLARLEQVKDQPVVLVGDFNIARSEIDLARPKDNLKNIMFTPEERGQLEKLLKLGFVDTFRQFSQEKGHYTWWPYWREARARNLGWRIDYCFISQSLKPRLKRAFILEDVLGSDHCPVGVEI